MSEQIKVRVYQRGVLKGEAVLPANIDQSGRVSLGNSLGFQVEIERGGQSTEAAEQLKEPAKTTSAVGAPGAKPAGSKS